MKCRRAIGASAAGLLAGALIAGCGVAGGRPAGPQELGTDLTVSADGLHLGAALCGGGTLKAAESPTAVTVTFLASAIDGGGMTCRLFPEEVALEAPLGGRKVIDGVNGKPVVVVTGSVPPTR